jgi:hypothetical protein
MEENKRVETGLTRWKNKIKKGRQKKEPEDSRGIRETGLETRRDREGRRPRWSISRMQVKAPLASARNTGRGPAMHEKEMRGIEDEEMRGNSEDKRKETSLRSYTLSHLL